MATLSEKAIDAFIEQAVQALSSFAADKGWLSLQTNHKVISVLKKIGLIELKDDFNRVYLFALAEYGIERQSIGLVSLFAEKEVREAYESDFREKTELLAATLEHHLHTSPKPAIIGLKQDFPNASRLYPEKEAFDKIFKSVLTKASDPGMLALFNDLNAGIASLLETNRKNSFEYQIEQYLESRIGDFQKKYLDGNRLVNLNGVKKAVFSQRGVWYKNMKIKWIDTKDMGEGADFKVRLETYAIDKLTELQLHSSPFEIDHDRPQSTKPEDVTYRPLDRYLNQWLQNSEARLLIIMGEYGTGKTTFTQHLTHQLAAQYLNQPCSRAIEDPKRRIPLYLPLRDFEKSLGTFVSDQCSNEYGINSLNYAEFKKRIQQDELLVILDGFDEMTQKIDADEKKSNFAKIHDLLRESPNSKFILTCREEYFHTDGDLLQLFGADADIDIIHLLPFDNEQIKQFLQSHSDNADYYWKQIDKTFDLKDLAKRPVLLELIIKYLPDLLQRKKENESIKASDLYQACIADELDRIDEKIHSVIRGKHRLDILKRLATWMYQQDTLSFDTRQIGEALNLKKLFNTKVEWEYEKRLSVFLTFTFLIREDDYQFRMSHKSFRDYLCALVFVEEINGNKAQNFSKTKMTKELQTFMLEHPLDKDYLLHLVLKAKTLTEENAWQGSNAANLLLALDKNALAAKKLNDCQLPDVNFEDCDLSDTSFLGTVLSRSSFTKSVLAGFNLTQADFSGCILTLRGVATLTGIEKLIGLHTLDCSSNQIVDLSPLACLSRLQVFDCSENQIVNLLPLAKLNSLQVFDCSLNRIVDLSPLANLSSLQMLDCSSNQLKDLPRLAELSSLHTLDCSFNQITTVDPIADLNSLQTLDCSSNLIKTLLPLAGLNNLRTLYCSFNKIQKLAWLADLNRLHTLDCSSNQIRKLIWLAGLSSLQTLDCSSNQIKDLSPLAALRSLQTLDCSTNQVKNLQVLKSLDNLRILFCSSNQIVDIQPLSGLNSLQELRLSKGAFDQENTAFLIAAIPDLKIKFV